MSWDYLIDVPGYSEIEKKMSDLNEKGLAAAFKAVGGSNGGERAKIAEDAIRAYEAHKASAEESALTYARRLCILMAERFYQDGSPDWRPLPDLVGILTQIDNMTTGLERAHNETTFDPTAQRGGVIPPPSTVPEEIAETVKELRGACIDWSGEPIVNESTPRVEVRCGLLRRATDLLERLSKDLEDAEERADIYMRQATD